MTDLTTREVSQRLMGVGFASKTQYYYYKDVHGSVTLRHDYYQAGSSLIEIPAYSASTLFEWLRAKYHSDPNLALDIQATEITIWLNIGHNPDEEEKEFEYKTSLADMLGESIIWILTQEKENK